jgi:small-conductance mechanosensitive channel
MYKVLKIIGLWLLLSSFMFSSGNNWTGTWHVTWKNGTFNLNLKQHGSDVNGTFTPGNGILHGTLKGNTLTAYTIAENNIKNKTIFTMGESGKSFFGNAKNGTWLAGILVEKDSDKLQHINLETPRKALYSFLSVGNSVRAGNYDALEVALDILHYSSEQESLAHAHKLALATKLFQVLDECLMDDLTFSKYGYKEGDSVIFHQLGSDINISVSFTFDAVNKYWKVNVPQSEVLDRQLKALLKARGKYEISPNDNVKLLHPRATMRTFFEEYDRWEEGGKGYIISTMNFSEIDPAIHEWQAPLLTFYLKSVIDRVSYVLFQGIPNDPKSKKPYVYFHHPIGNIVIAPYEIEGKIKWQFTPKTLATIDDLYNEMEHIKSKYQTKAIKDNNLYFGLKSFFKNISPILLKTVSHTEIWQMVMLVIIILAALLVSMLIRYVVTFSFNSFYYTKRWTEEMITLGYIRPVQIATFGMVLLNGAHQLGLSNLLFSSIKSLSHLLMVIGMTWLSYNLVSIFFSLLQIKARRTETDVDEIIISLAGSITRIVVITIAIFLVAEIFNIPYKTVIAGLGIGGLAFAIAAKDTISNFFGSAIIIADRPFKTGDRVKIGTDIGVITYVGIRSTKIRTIYDTLLTVPNNKITHEMIDNYSEREAMRFDTEFFFSLETAKDTLDKLDTNISSYLNNNESVETKKIILTGVNDFTKRGISFGVTCFVKATTEVKYSEIRHTIMTELAQIIKDLDIELVMIRHEERVD